MDVVAAGIDIQKALPFGTVYDAREMVRRALAEGKPGKWIKHLPCNDVQPDTPVENVVVLFEASVEYGWYSVADL